MSSAARFLLEFEATGDQEVVNKIRGVGAAGKQTATDLQALQGVQDPFAEVASGAESAVSPIQEVGTASAETTGLMTELGTEGTAAATGIEELGTKTEESAEKSMGFGEALGTMTGSIAAIGGSIGSLIGSFTRYNEIQLKVQKAQLTSARATEMSRKAEEGLDKVLATATTNTTNIAAARDRLAKAQANMNKLMDQGVTSGSAFEAAQNEVAAAQKNLSAEFAKGGGDVAKLTTAMEKSEINSAKMVTSLNNLELAYADQKKGVLDMVFGFSSLAGSMVQTLSSVGKWGPALKTVSGGFKDLISWVGRGGFSFAAFATTITGTVLPVMGGILLAAAAVLAAYEGFRGIPKIFDFINAAIEGNMKKMLDSGIQLMELFKNIQMFSPTGAAMIPLIDETIKKLKEAAAARKITIDTVEQEKSAQSGLGQILDQIPQKYKDMINEALGMEIIPPTSKFAAESIAEVGGAATGAGKAVASLAPPIDQTMAKIDALSNQIITLAFDLLNAGQPMKVLGHTLVELGGGWRVIDGELKKGTQTIDTSTGALERQQKGLAYLNDITGTWTSSTVTAAESQADFQKELDGVIESADETAQRIEATVKAYDDAKAAGDKWAESLKLQEVETASMIDAMQKQENQEQGVRNALQETTLTLEQSNQAFRESEAIRNSAAATSNLVQDALNKEIISLNENEIALRARDKAAGDSEIQLRRLIQAHQEGAVAAREFIASLDEEAQRQQAYRDGLLETVSALGVFGDATTYTTEQLENFASISERVPEALAGLASEIGALAQEATKFVEFAGEEDELFGNWKIAKDLPDEIRDMMSDSDRAFIEGRAQLERSLESLGPLVGVKFARAIQQGGGAGLEELRKFGPEAADIIRQSGAEMDPAVQELVHAFDALETVTAKNMPEAMARVVSAMENVKDPAAGLTAQLLQMYDAGQITSDGLEQLTDAGIITNDSLAELAKTVPGLAESMAGTTEGLNSLFDAMDSVAGQGKTLVLDFEKLNKVVIDGVGTFVQVGDQLLKVPGQADAAAGGLAQIDVNATAAATKLKALHTVLTLLPQVEVAPKINVDATEAANKIQATKTALTILNNATVTPKIDVNAQAAASKIQATAKALQILNKTTVIPKVDVNATAAASKIKATARALQILHRTTVTPKITINNSQAMSAISRVKSALSGLKNISRTITYTYKIVGRRPAQFGMHETLGEDTVIAAHKGERVDISPTGGPAIEQPGPTHTIYSQSGGRGGGREIVIPVTLMLDNKVLIRTVRRGLVEEVSGAM